MKMKPREWTAFVIAAVAGAAGWIVVSGLTGKREAWDAELYFAWFMPSIALVITTLAYFVPEKAWRWALIPFGAQAAVAFVHNPTANLLPLGLIVFAAYGALCLVFVVAGKWIRRMVDRQRNA